MARDIKVSMLLPYFQQYMDRGFFPDGRGMLYQPIVLINALELFVSIFRRYEKDDFEKRMKK
jgi:hypothetical protein